MRYIFNHLYNAGVSFPRGLLTKELLNYHYSVKPGDELLAHPRRKLNMDYVKRELSWYLKGHRYDKSIVAFAKTWEGCIASDGGINSNYGQYLFGAGMGLDRCFGELAVDKDSRRAVAMILGQHSLHFSSTNDVPCTIGLQFLIRPDEFGVDELITIATMRSQDAIYGLGNDVPAFMFFGKLLASALSIKQGELHVNVGSLHVYERHFQMLDGIAMFPEQWTRLDVIPDIGSSHAAALIMGRHVFCPLTDWLELAHES